MNQIAARILLLAWLLPATSTLARPPPDKDLDGIADSEDICPYTPLKARVDAQGCSLDADFDGVADGSDECPNSPFGTPVSAEGCTREERADVPAIDVIRQRPPATAQAAAEPAIVEITPPQRPVAATPAPAKPEPRVVAAPFGYGTSSSALAPASLAPSLQETSPEPAAKPAATAPAAPAPSVAQAEPAATEEPAPAAEAAVPQDESPATADAGSTVHPDHAELLPLLNDEDALLDAIDRRNRERELAEERQSQQQLSRLLDQRSGTRRPNAEAPAAARQRTAPATQARPRPPVAPVIVATKPAPLIAAPSVTGRQPRNTERLFSNVMFAQGKSQMTAASLKDLAGLTPDLARVMKHLPKLRVEVVGHADGPTEGARAEKLASDRALTVNAYLIAHGVPPGRIKRLNRADQNPLVTGGDGSDNRVVEIYTYPQ